jgi:peroxiredoxin
LKHVILRGILSASLCLGLLLLFSGCQKDKKETVPGKAHDFSLKSLEGEDVVLSGLRGSVVLLDFWATWCAPCRESIPHLIDLHKTYQERGLKIVGMSIDKEKDAEALRHFAKSFDIPYAIVLAPENVVKQYGVSGIPATFLIDRKGNIRERIVGFNNTIAKHLATRISDLIEEKPQ